MYKFVSDQGIENLKHYAYHGVDNSICGRLFLNTFWAWAVEFMPRWLAPNVITLTGGVFMVIAYGLCVLYTPHLTEPLPGWCLCAIGLLIFLYQLADNIDGKQAKRTKSGSALGELFDHGVDSIVMGLIAGIASSVLRGPVTTSVVGSLMAMTPFYLAHWEEYHAGILIMGEFNGPTEFQLMVIAVCLYTALFGADFWHTPLPGSLGVYYKYNHGLFILIAFFVVFGIFMSLVKVYRLCAAKQSCLKNCTPLESFSQPLPLALFIALTLIWVYSTEATAVAHPHLYFTAITLVYAYLTQRLLVQRICKEPFRAAYKVQIPLGLVAINGLLFRMGSDLAIHPYPAVIIFIGVSLALELSFVISIINQLTDSLNIRAFKIKY
jgi:ethanolaminephosphotransferase